MRGVEAWLGRLGEQSLVHDFPGAESLPGGAGEQ
jgi:hypothetical protein